MPTLTPHLWFDTQAKEAAEFYATVFSDSSVDNVSVLKNTPSGDCDVVSFTVRGQKFMSISAGPYFKLNPSISFMVNFDPSHEEDTREQMDAAWEKLTDGGKVLMELGTYPFSEHYGWVEDKYGVSWQLILTKPEGEDRPTILPSLLFTGDVCGRAEEAIDFYVSIFKDAKRGATAHYPAGMEPDKEGSLMFGDFRLLDMWIVAMDSAHKHEFAFNEAVSFIINCDTQEEIDYYWEKLSAVPESEQCGWLKDKFGVSWQVNPTVLEKMMNDSDEKRVARVTAAFLQMKKFDIAALQKAYDGV